MSSDKLFEKDSLEFESPINFEEGIAKIVSGDKEIIINTREKETVLYGKDHVMIAFDNTLRKYQSFTEIDGKIVMGKKLIEEFFEEYTK